MSTALKFEPEVQTRRPTLSVISDSPIQSFLSRLDRVRQTGKGYTARCPAHEDRTASLSMTSADDGRVLLHCFAGCGAADVVAAVGMELRDLFVKRPTADMSFAERAALKEHGRQAQWRAALNVMALESKIVHIAARELMAGKKLDSEDVERLRKSMNIIDHARGVLCVTST